MTIAPMQKQGVGICFVLHDASVSHELKFFGFGACARAWELAPWQKVPCKGHF